MQNVFRTGVKDGSRASGGIKSNSCRRYIDDFLSNADRNEVDVVQRRPPRVSQELRVLHAHGLGGGAESQRSREGQRPETRQTVRERGLVK